MADLFRGKKLFRGEKPVDPSELQNKIVGLYFSASWCPPCRQFTPLLKETYESLEGEAFEVVFLTSDRSREDTMLYYSNNQGPWLLMEFNDPFIEELKEKYKVTGIPKLIIINRKGDVISMNGREDVQSKQAAALKDWKDAKCS